MGLLSNQLASEAMTSIISAILGLWRLAEEGGMFKDDLTQRRKDMLRAAAVVLSLGWIYKSGTLMLAVSLDVGCPQVLSRIFAKSVACLSRSKCCST